MTWMAKGTLFPPAVVSNNVFCIAEFFFRRTMPNQQTGLSGIAGNTHGRLEVNDRR